MGTNYYAILPALSNDRPPEQVHIGKSSAGWCFALRVHPDLNLWSWDDWWDWLALGAAQVQDEYGEDVSLPKLLMVVTCRKNQRFPALSAQFFEDNYAQLGPNNLLRSRIGRNCIGHGPGPWDLIIGDFS